MTAENDNELERKFQSWLLKELNEFAADLLSEDELGSVIRAHVRIEYLLRQALKNWIPHPEYIDKLDPDYDAIITIALMHGMDERYGPPFRALGKLRNDFAHKTGTKLTKQSVNNLYKCLSSEDKKGVQGLLKELQDKYDFASTAGPLADAMPVEQFQLIALKLWAIAKAMAITVRADPAD